jgi:uncharacterized protein YjbI with pentapeptide repeats
LKEGVEAWNAWRSGQPQIKVDLSESNLQKVDLEEKDLSEAIIKATGSKADLRGANLDGADLRYARLGGTDLTKANLRKANLGSASLHAAHLSGADLTEANLFLTNLSEADLSGARLTRTSLILADLRLANLNNAMLNLAGMLGTSLIGAQLSGTDMTGTSVGEAVFADTDLSTVRGLDTVHHGGPSTIGIDTIYKSGGKISETFLRGCGVPDEFITFAKSLVTSPIQFYSCFISYSSKDDEFATELHCKLQAQHVRCWRDSEDLKIGDKFQDVIDSAIRLHDKLLLVLSENSINSSWVEWEVKKALKKEQEHGATVLFPVRLDDAVMETPYAWAAEVRKRHIGDFRKWKDHDSFQKSLDRLLRDLKSQDSKPK